MVIQRFTTSPSLAPSSTHHLRWLLLAAIDLRFSHCTLSLFCRLLGTHWRKLLLFGIRIGVPAAAATSSLTLWRGLSLERIAQSRITLRERERDQFKLAPAKVPFARHWLSLSVCTRGRFICKSSFARKLTSLSLAGHSSYLVHYHLTSH